MTTRKHTAAKDMPNLPPDVKVGDLQYPSWRSKTRVIDSLNFYEVTGFGWCIATLLIRAPGRRHADGATARTYAVRISDGALVRVGLGPHVLQRITVYVTDKRQAALQKYIDLKNKGEVEANVTRDRISTRRAWSSQRRYAW